MLFPEKTDSKSAGCNFLIKQNYAALLTDAQQLIEALGWQQKKPKSKHQKELFIDLSKDEKIIVDILKEKDAVHIDELTFKSELSSSAIAASILNLELQNVIVACRERCIDWYRLQVTGCKVQVASFR